MNLKKIISPMAALLLLLFCFPCPLLSHLQQDRCADLERICASLAGTPYVWGGTDKDGVDCSGFIHLVAKFYGQPVPRTTSKKLWLSNKSEPVGWEEAKCGYQVWWTFSESRPYGHTGIMVSPPLFWQSGRSKGVYKRSFFKNSFWDQHFSGAKKLFTKGG